MKVQQHIQQGGAQSKAQERTAETPRMYMYSRRSTTRRSPSIPTMQQSFFDTSDSVIDPKLLLLSQSPPVHDGSAPGKLITSGEN
jgi:hypothetical protein